MGTTKLTLSVNREIVDEAKRAALGWHTSVSALFARVLRAMTSSCVADLSASPVTRRASGLVKLHEDVSDSDLLTDALMAKYESRP
jgi:hypothetical protein